MVDQGIKAGDDLDVVTIKDYVILDFPGARDCHTTKHGLYSPFEAGADLCLGESIPFRTRSTILFTSSPQISQIVLKESVGKPSGPGFLCWNHIKNIVFHFLCIRRSIEHFIHPCIYPTMYMR
jgi:hypothetical protein